MKVTAWTKKHFVKKINEVNPLVTVLVTGERLKRGGSVDFEFLAQDGHDFEASDCPLLVIAYDWPTCEVDFSSMSEIYKDALQNLDIATYTS